MKTLALLLQECAQGDFVRCVQGGEGDFTVGVLYPVFADQRGERYVENDRGDRTYYGVYPPGGLFFEKLTRDRAEIAKVYNPGPRQAVAEIPETAPAVGYPDNNPKTAIGLAKPPLNFVPPVALIHLGLAMENGGTKYGPMNWRDAEISASVYYDAAMRHLLSWWDGEDRASDSGVHHLSHAMACCAIALDAIEQGKFNDNRPTAGTVVPLIERLNAERKARQDERKDAA